MPDVNPLGPTSPPGGAGEPPPQQAPAVVMPAPAVGPGGRRELVAFVVSYQADPFGAADNLDLEINDPTTSSQHAAFNVDAATRGVQLEDLGSTNGTFVNEEPLGSQGRREVRDGDRIRFGGFTLVLKVIPRV
jgi:hypothetical protein